MRNIIYTKDLKHPRIVFELSCDLDLLTACVKDGETNPKDIVAAVQAGMRKINDAILKGQAKAREEAAEV